MPFEEGKMGRMYYFCSLIKACQKIKPLGREYITAGADSRGPLEMARQGGNISHGSLRGQVKYFLLLPIEFNVLS